MAKPKSIMPPKNEQFTAVVRGNFNYFRAGALQGSVPFELTISDYYSEGYAYAAGKEIMDAEAERRHEFMRKMDSSFKVTVTYMS